MGESVDRAYLQLLFASEGNETDSDKRAYMGEELPAARLEPVSTEGSSSRGINQRWDLVDDFQLALALSNGPVDVGEPNSASNMLESIESKTENLLNERMVARAAYLEEVKDLEDANYRRVVEAIEFEAVTEWSIQETTPLNGSHLLAQSLHRSQSLLASKQELQKIDASRNLIQRIDDAMDNERQLVISITNTARDTEDQQKQLRDLEQIAYQKYLDLIKNQHKELMELSKNCQEKKEHHLNVWAVARSNTLDVVQGIESNSQDLLDMLHIVVETAKKQETKLEAEVTRLRVETLEETAKSCTSECQVCFDLIEGPSSERLGNLRTRDLKQRSCLIPCNHAMICLPCATHIWESNKLCPFCNAKLTAKPHTLFLG